ncbi:ZPR1 zinc-finger domain-containing protein [Ephemerocybe angulata]|uniref:ZPR1 zinc-finger domain-containing protein n=1 Tax=Ephemerocybe angulata TaxID=980116 RepID=A0A8H6HCD5_9AGAR|nr:ZPR1 zinc-finger domain-containing protein [Tulosesus angulatus]
MSSSNELFPKIGQVADKTTKDDSAEAEVEEKVVDEIDSLCMKCFEQGKTRMLLTSIPYFKEVVVMSFRCEHCGWSNNEIQSAGMIRPEGTLYTAKIRDRADLNRQIVRSSNCEIVIPELDLTLPPTERGQLTTVEGLLRDIITDLSGDQPLRKVQDEDTYTKVEALLTKMWGMLGDSPDAEDNDVEDAQTAGTSEKKDIPVQPFTLKLDDPSGNSFIEFLGSMSDPKWNLRTYPRTFEQNVQLGLVAREEEGGEKGAGEEQVNGEVTKDEVLTFPGKCSSCGHNINTYMKRVDIPYFKEILIMSTNCDTCGYRDNEVKSGSAISPEGKRIILKVEDVEDLSRDILKSETAGLEIPEIDLVLAHGTLGGRFTTLEGILNQVYEELNEKVFAGDSAETEDKRSFEKFLEDLKSTITCEKPFTVILDDPLANSYIQSLYAPDPDPGMTIETYPRTWEQNEELGLNDIKVEGYEEDEAAERAAEKEAQEQEKKEPNTVQS